MHFPKELGALVLQGGWRTPWSKEVKTGGFSLPALRKNSWRVLMQPFHLTRSLISETCIIEGPKQTPPPWWGGGLCAAWCSRPSRHLVWVVWQHLLCSQHIFCPYCFQLATSWDFAACLCNRYLAVTMEWTACSRYVCSHSQLSRTQIITLQRQVFPCGRSQHHLRRPWPVLQ